MQHLLKKSYKLLILYKYKKVSGEEKNEMEWKIILNRWKDVQVLTAEAWQILSVKMSSLAVHCAVHMQQHISQWQD